MGLGPTALGKGLAPAALGRGRAAYAARTPAPETAPRHLRTTALPHFRTIQNQQGRNVNASTPITNQSAAKIRR